MKKILLIFLFIIGSFPFAFATHNKAGEVTFKHLYGLTYQACVTTYTDCTVIADRPKIELKWGDGNTDTLTRANGPLRDGVPFGEVIGNNTKHNVYCGTHTYPGPDIYIISFEDPNRVDYVENIPNSVNIAFYVQTVLSINPSNSSPVLLQPPIDNGCVGKIFIHNPNAYDPDGTDSLSYILVYCKGENGKDIAGYTYPSASNSLTLNPVTGDLIWDSPQQQGKYNIAFRIEEWRNGTKISYVTRDMQITIGVCNNNPPVIDPIPDICVIAGDTISFDVKATNTNPYERMTLSATGAPFTTTVNPAKFPQDATGTGSVKGKFTWETTCKHLRKKPYQVLFKAENNSASIRLVDLKTANITIVAPAPKNLTAMPIGNSIALSWNDGFCSDITAYKIYRRNSFYTGTIQCPCQTGVPDTIGFSLITTVSGTNHNYTDDNNGVGLIHGIDYCYFVVAVYADNAQSCASTQVCAKLRKDLPIITNVDIKKTDNNNGVIYVAWSKPTELDTIAIPPPYKYLIYRSNNFRGTNFTLLDSVGMMKGLDDTTFTDTHVSLATAVTPYSYRIDLYSGISGKFYVGSTQIASSIFLSIAPTDNRLNLSWEEHIPWTNYRYDIYRFNPSTSSFDSIGTTTSQQYSDVLLNNGTTYCYKIKSVGEYSAPGFGVPFINYSQEQCAVPIDNIPPCAPHLTVYPNCNDFQNQLVWNNPNNTCANDVLGYNIYFTSVLNGDYKLIATNHSPTDTTFLHDKLLQSIAGCYLITALDSGNNESKNTTLRCVDNCPEYQLPNVFTPDGNNQNDLLIPFPYRYVKDVDMKIFNRWGVQVFNTSNPNINWNGKNQNTKKDCSDGVYYYVCDVHTIHLEGLRTKTLKGFVHLIRNK